MPKVSKLVGAPFDRASWEREIAEDAVKFAGSRFVGGGGYDTIEAPTFAEIEAKIEAIGGINRWMVYAVNADGHKTLVQSRGKPVRPGD